MGKTGLCLGYLAQLAVKTINGVNGVDQSAYLLRVLEIGTEMGPVSSPGLGDFWVFLVPTLSKGLLIYCGIGRLQISYKSLQILVGHILQELCSWWSMQFWSSICRKVARMAASNPFKLSVWVMKYPLHSGFSVH